MKVPNPSRYYRERKKLLALSAVEGEAISYLTYGLTAGFSRKGK